MKRKITKVAIIGSGTMGSGIASHLANVGIKSYLLDIIPKELTKEEMDKGLTLESPVVRNRIVSNNRESFVIKAKPAGLMDKNSEHLIMVGNIEDNLSVLSECDWIIEVVSEKLSVKQAVLKKILPYIKPKTIVSSNTSGISINEIAKGLPLEFRQYWMGTHFFNPVRYMKLMEIIPCDDTLLEIVEFMREFGEKTLGKGVVICNDTPNFIANRVGVSLGTNIINLMMNMDLSISEVDEITGTLMGRPKTATFALYDLVGLDIGVTSATVVHDNVSDEEEKENLKFPPFIYKMYEKNMLGNKTKGGFYKRQGKEKLMIDPTTLEYVPLKKAEFESIEKAKACKSLPEKLEVLFDGKDKAAKFVWEHMKSCFLNTCKRIPEISDNIFSVDRALRWGFNHDKGPFEVWNGLDIEKYVKRMESEKCDVPAWVKEMISLGYKSFYKTENGQEYCYSIIEKKYVLVPVNVKSINLQTLKSENKTIKSMEAGTLYDIGNGIACLEMHTKTSAINEELLEAISIAQDELDENWDGLVITSANKNFCVGADLNLILSLINDKKWSEIGSVLKISQDIYMRNKYSYKPVVIAPFGMVLGGGCEITIQSSAIQAYSETYMGLVELGVGLIPAGGGVKEMTLRAIERVKGTDAFTNEFILPNLMNIAMAKVSTSAKDAENLGYIKKTDSFTMNQELLIYDAKKKALELIERNYAPEFCKPFPAPGINNNAVALMHAKVMKDAGMISEYDMHLIERVLYIMTGGNVTGGTLINEQYLLDLEREVFVDLCKEKKTQERIISMLTKGKPLRN